MTSKFGTLGPESDSVGQIIEGLFVSDRMLNFSLNITYDEPIKATPRNILPRLKFRGPE